MQCKSDSMFSLLHFILFNESSYVTIVEPFHLRKSVSELDNMNITEGEIVVTNEYSTLSTCVGTGICVCIWDKTNHIAGMNHFLEPAFYKEDKTTARYGNVSMPTMIKMIEKSASFGTHEAHIFGGVGIESGNIRAEDNIGVAREALSINSIPVISQDVGGNKKRRVIFEVATGNAIVLKVQ